jgi:hypothetical protein
MSTFPPNPRFTGIFIPKEILEMSNLSLFEMMLLSWIDALYCPDHCGCYASNDFLGKNINDTKENTVAKAITKLRKLGLIEDVSFDGRIRVIRALINRFVDKKQSKAALDKNPKRVGEKSNPRLEKNPSKVPPSPYNTYIKEDSNMSELPFGRVASYFYEKLRSINPKVKKPNLHKWTQEFQLLAKDGNSEEDILKTIDYVVGTYQEPAANGFCWANVVLSPNSLRKNFPKIWGELQRKKQTILSPAENKNLAIRINEKFKRDDIILGHNYLEFINGQYANHLKFEDKDFKEKCIEELTKRKLNSKGLS